MVNEINKDAQIEEIYVVIYEIGKERKIVKIKSGSTVKEILIKAGKDLKKNDQFKRVRDVSEWGEQPYLDMEDTFNIDHGMLFLGEHEPPAKE